MPKTAVNSPEAQVDGLAVLPLLGFLGFTPKSARVISDLRPRPSESKGRKRFCVATGGLAVREYTPPTGPVMLRMEPDAADPLAEGHAAVLAVQEGCCVAASQGGGAASAEAGGHREAAGGHCVVASAAAHSEPEAQFH